MTDLALFLGIDEIGAVTDRAYKESLAAPLLGEEGENRFEIGGMNLPLSEKERLRDQ
jgi:hypothetical protein